jgi:hypothetical protein
MDIKSAHKYCFHNKELLIKHKKCGCFYCLSIFKPSDIKEWVDEEQTAICPKCGIDSILPDNDGMTSIDFLIEMNAYWFPRWNPESA